MCLIGGTIQLIGDVVRIFLFFNTNNRKRGVISRTFPIDYIGNHELGVRIFWFSSSNCTTTTTNSRIKSRTTPTLYSYIL